MSFFLALAHSQTEKNKALGTGAERFAMVKLAIQLRGSTLWMALMARDILGNLALLWRISSF